MNQIDTFKTMDLIRETLAQITNTNMIDNNMTIGGMGRITVKLVL